MKNLKYFCKYLPVEGEIKEGDKVLYLGKLREVSLMDNRLIIWGGEAFVQILTEKKVKLFLCSRDIEMGNKVLGNIESKEEYTFMEGMNAKYCTKVVGEISKDALSYVKEGMEYDEEDVKNTNVRLFSWEPYIYQIKGPCGHFH